MELEAIRLALMFAGETGCALYVVRVSSYAEVSLSGHAVEAGVNVTCETCPHHRVLNAEDVERIGAPAERAPLLRSDGELATSCYLVHAGFVDTIGSDHSPAPPL